jgi:hypothetical protein
MATNLPLILILDENSRIGSNISIPSILSYGIVVLNSLNEINPEQHTDKPVVILEGYMQKPDGFHDLVLYKELFGLTYIYLGTDSHFLDIMKDHASVYCMDYSKLDYKMLQTVYSGSPDHVRMMSVSETQKLSGIARIFQDSSDVSLQVKELAIAYLNMVSEVRELRVKDKLNSSRMRELEGLNHIQELRISSLSAELNRMFNEAIKMNDYIKQFNFLLRPDIYDKVELSKFPSPPRILYFKEYGDFCYLNSFIKTVADSIKSHMHVPYKVVRLIDNKDSTRAIRLSKYYKIFSGSYTLPELYGNDFIAVTDGYVGLLETLFNNQNSLDVLIIVDSKLHNDVVISGSYLLYNLCRNPDDIDLFRLDPNSVISNFENGTMSWDYFEEYSELNAVDRFLYLSSRPVIGMVESTFKYFY